MFLLFVLLDLKDAGDITIHSIDMLSSSVLLYAKYNEYNCYIKLIINIKLLICYILKSCQVHVKDMSRSYFSMENAQAPLFRSAELPEGRYMLLLLPISHHIFHRTDFFNFELKVLEITDKMLKQFLCRFLQS